MSIIAKDDPVDKKIKHVVEHQLTELDLSKDWLFDVPESVGKLYWLESLIIRYGEFSTLPDFIGNLTNLQSLDLSYSYITALPESIGNLTNLQCLDLPCTLIKDFPESIGNLTNLKKLRVNSIQIKILPDSIGNLTNIEELNLNSTLITSLPDSIGNLTNLKKLRVNNTQIKTLPDSIGNLTNIEELNLNSTLITSLPDSIGNLTNLKKLRVNNTQIKTLPDSIGNLTNIEELNLNSTLITSLPDSIGNLTNIEELNLNSTLITSLPDSIGNLTNLKKLRVNNTQIKILPDSIGNLTNIEELNLNSTLITSLPDSIGYLTNLQCLDLSFTQIRDIPSSLGKLSKITLLSLTSTPLNPEILAVWTQGTDALLLYLRERAKEEILLNETKLILVGEGEVGKSCLLGALRLDEWVEDRDSTHGIEIKPLNLKKYNGGKKLNLICWDFGGQKVYRPTHQFFFSAPAIYLVVWKPREGPEQGFVDYWIKLIKNRTYDKDSGKIPLIIVVATHGGPKERQAYIDETTLRKTYGDLIVDFFHVNSKSGVNIKKLKKKIAKVALSITKGGRKIASSWKKATDIIQNNCEESPYLKYNVFVSLCAEEGISDDITALYATILHELGYCIYYSENEGLKDIIILNPEWLSKAISFVLEDKKVKKGNGLVEHRHLGKIWMIHIDRKMHGTIESFIRYFFN